MRKEGGGGGDEWFTHFDFGRRFGPLITDIGHRTKSDVLDFWEIRIKVDANLEGRVEKPGELTGSDGGVRLGAGDDDGRHDDATDHGYRVLEAHEQGEHPGEGLRDRVEHGGPRSETVAQVGPAERPSRLHSGGWEETELGPDTVGSVWERG